MEHSIFFHEDYYRQIELIPHENYFTIVNNTNSNDSHYDNNNGFVSITERKEQKLTTEELNIQFDSLEKKIAHFVIEKYFTVKTGYSNNIKIKENTVALGFEKLAIFFELTKTGTVKNIWLCQSIDLPKLSTSNNLLNSLVTLGKEYNLILVDWNEEVAIRLSSINTVMTYLKENFHFTFTAQ